jgi:hypothetical protein
MISNVLALLNNTANSHVTTEHKPQFNIVALCHNTVEAGNFSTLANSINFIL